ncbi:MAG TPA: GNAT family N-acetyltransferase [Pirellulales bacterium]|nr:GNAT family N-acetyltransferase [Pirellulales bacterium]
MSSILLRDATTADLPAISDIYNYYVHHSTCTYQLQPETLADRQAWFSLHAPERFPVVVVEQVKQVVGWGSLSKFHARAGYDGTVEASVYIADGFHRRGLGRMVLEHLIERARRNGFHVLIGGASADQTASIALQESLGFTRVGHLKEVGRKFDQWLDVVYLQLIL